MTTSGGTLILDSWALIEELFDGPRRAELDEHRRAASRLVTVRDVLFETYAYIQRRAGPAFAREWWRAFRETRTVVLQPSLDDIDALFARLDGSVGLSAVDVAVAWAAKKEGATEVATGDRAFAALGLTPLFA